MTPGDFLRAIWPSEGVYCIATPFVITGSNPPVRVYAHKTFDNISDAVSFVLGERTGKDLFFAVHTLKEHTVWNPEKINRKTGEAGATEVRTQRNSKASRAFFFDIDVGPEQNKYDTPAEAVGELKRFCASTKLPRPLIVTSGGGLHVYWTITDAIESNEWRNHAMKLKQLARHYGLKVDPMRTTDTASVLRVAGTLNFKNRSNARPVAAMTPVSETGTGVFIALLDKAMVEAGVQPVTLPKLDVAANELGSNTAREYDGPPVSLKAVLLSCAQMRRLAMAARAKQHISEPEWYHGVIGVGRFLEDGHRRIMQFASDASWHASIKEKIKQSEQVQKGPTSCAKLAEVSAAGDEPCIGCPFAGKVHGPISAARFNDPAPAPVVHELVGTAEPVVVQIPEPPKPFIRMKDGGIAIKAKNPDGDETFTTIYDHDLFPVRRLSNPGQGIEQHVWHVKLPRNDEKDFTLDADMLYDSRKFVTAISNQGIYPHKSNIPYLQEYMVAYIAQLQKLVDADAQCNHLGWTDDHSKFILPDKVLSVDGSARAAQLSLGAQRASAQVHKKGDAAMQAQLLDFYNHPAYRPNQFYILAGLGAPLFFATGHHGVIINASGDAGASKSTSLYAAASFWGSPELYPINGTNNGATVRGRNERVTVLANLPVCVDEITHMPPRDAIDLAMSITQPGHRIRLQTDGVERASVDSYKATIMLTTANNSLHGVLSTDNAAGTAGSMRVFEIMFEAKGVHTKPQADDFLHALKQNYGHLGERFILHVMANLDEVKARIRDVMREVDTDLRIQSSERFWSGAIADVLVTGEIANKLGIVRYDMAALKDWVYTVQVPHMRGVVKEEYSDPLGILTDYLETISGNMIVSRKMSGGNLTNVMRAPHGSLLAHYNVDDNQLIVLKKGFKDYCTRIGASMTKIIDELSEQRDGAVIIANPHTRRVLGAGTEYAKGQSWCFAINMSHKDVSGVVDVSVIPGGGQPLQGSPTGLRAVQ